LFRKLPQLARLLENHACLRDDLLTDRRRDHDALAALEQGNSEKIL
jgi:hypothetical protein